MGVRIIGISGSLRQGSFNTSLLREAAAVAPQGATIEVRTIHGIPLYDADVENGPGVPEVVEAPDDERAAILADHHVPVDDEQPVRIGLENELRRDGLAVVGGGEDVGDGVADVVRRLRQHEVGGLACVGLGAVVQCLLNPGQSVVVDAARYRGGLTDRLDQSGVGGRG